MLFALALSGSSAYADSIGYTGSETTYTITVTGTYDIDAAGAQGGDGRSTADAGGLGAIIDGDVFLTAGTELGIVVGGVGGNGETTTFGGGGGGGTFVFVVGATNPLIVAGGGGGAVECCADGGDAQLGTAGAAGSGTNPGVGGTNGDGGTGGTAEGSGGGGAGWFSNGTDGAGGYNGFGGFGPPSFAGGTGFLINPGGFGGGGGGSIGSGGGGGGYSGGGGGGYSGGGGGSFEDDSVTLNTATVGNIGNGYVDITAVAPEPGSVVLLGLGFAGLVFAARRRSAA